jgi:DNA-binding response OmpR family regulator
MRVLVIEDFEPLRQALGQGLQEAGFVVEVAGDGESGLRHARSDEHDVIILDLMLPKIDGLTVLNTLRTAGCPAFILVLTARDTPLDRIQGLNAGADDYLVKPFVFAELLARVRALVRRKNEAKSSIIHIADLELDQTRREVRRTGNAIELSAREYALLEYLVMNAHRIVTRAEIEQCLFDTNSPLESNVIDVFVSLLRKKIEGQGLPRLLHTRRGQGYVLTDRGDAG